MRPTSAPALDTAMRWLTVSKPCRVVSGFLLPDGRCQSDLSALRPHGIPE